MNFLKKIIYTIIKIKIFRKIYYFGGTIYRGSIGIYHNLFDKIPTINSGAKKQVIGHSVQKKEITAYQPVANEAQNKNILIVGGIHGNEVGTVKLSSHLVNHFKQGHFNKSVINLFIIPCLNPDGFSKATKNPDYFHRGKTGRLNTHNVDLNRNFPTKNFQSKSTWRRGREYGEYESEVFCGEFGASEPEIKSIIDFIQQKDIKYIISLHNVGKDVIINEEDKVVANIAELFKNHGFKLRFDLNYSGGFSDWCAENSIHYLSVEIPHRWGSNRRRLVEVFEETINNF